MRSLPGDIKDAVRFITERGPLRVKVSCGGQFTKLEERARLLAPKLNEIRGALNMDQSATGARLHVPLLEELLTGRDMGGKNRRGQFARGPLMLRDLPGPGGFPACAEVAGALSREEFPKPAKSGVKFPKKGPDSNAQRLWRDASIQVAEGWLRGPLMRTVRGELVVNGKETIANPAYRQATSWAIRLRALHDPKKLGERGHGRTHSNKSSLMGSHCAALGLISLPRRKWAFSYRESCSR